MVGLILVPWDPDIPFFSTDGKGVREMLQARKSFTNLRRSISPRGGTGLVGSLLHTIGSRRFISAHASFAPPLPPPAPLVVLPTSPPPRCRKPRIRSCSSFRSPRNTSFVFPGNGTGSTRSPPFGSKGIRSRTDIARCEWSTFRGLGGQGAVVVWCSVTPTVAPLESSASSFVVKLDERNDSRLIYGWLG